jgi:hypothetical protein
MEARLGARRELAIWRDDLGGERRAAVTQAQWRGPSELLVRERAAKHDGKANCRSAAGVNEGTAGNIRNSQVDGRDGRTDFRLGAGPRKRRMSPDNPLRKPRTAVGGVSGGIGYSAAAGTLVHVRWRATVARPAISASEVPLAGTPRCNSVLGGPRGETAARNLSRGRPACAANVAHALALAVAVDHAAMSPREVLLPDGQVSGRRSKILPETLLTTSGLLSLRR